MVAFTNICSLAVCVEWDSGNILNELISTEHAYMLKSLSGSHLNSLDSNMKKITGDRFKTI